MPLPRPRGHEEANAPAPHAPESLLPDNTPLEFRVIISACRVFLGTEEPARLDRLLSQDPDWDWVQSLANQHGVMPILYRSLGRADKQLVPQETVARLRMMYMQNAARNIKMTGELLRILDALEKAGIKAMPLKGPALAQMLYGDVTLRQFSDLDILVTRDDADKALIILEDKGYQVTGEDPRRERSEKKRAAMLDCLYNYDLINKSFGTHIELHWQLSQSLRHLNTNDTAIWERSNTLCLLGKEVSNVSNEHYIIYLSQHGSRHLWTRLAWLCDLAKLMGINKESWNLSLTIAKESRNERVLLLGIILADKLLYAHPPEEVLQGMKYDEDLENLSKTIIAGIFSPHYSKDDSIQAVADLILYQDVLRIREKCAFYFDIITKPTKTDFESLPLPEVLFPAYRLIRPIRLMKTYGRAFMEQLKKEGKCQ